MNEFVDQLVDKAKSTYNQAFAKVKDKIFDITGTSSVTVEQLALFIQNHPDTSVSKKNLLGRTYAFFRLNTEENSYYLETKDGQILQLDAKSQNTSIISYRSYRDKNRLNTPIKMPPLI